MKALKEEYVNPFDVNLKKEQLINLISGVYFPDEIAFELLYQLGVLVKKKVKSSVQRSSRVSRTDKKKKDVFV